MKPHYSLWVPFVSSVCKQIGGSVQMFLKQLNGTPECLSGYSLIIIQEPFMKVLEDGNKKKLALETWRTDYTVLYGAKNTYVQLIHQTAHVFNGDN